MRRLIFVAAILAFLVTGDRANCQTPESNGADDAIIARLDDVLKRLDQIERRLAVIERRTGMGRGYWIDHNSVMRLPAGRPIGWWGIDVVPPRAAR